MALTLAEIARSVGGEVIGDEKIEINGINSLDEASEGEISFFADRRYEESAKKTKASALLVSQFVDFYKGVQVMVSDPGLAYARVAGLFAPPEPRFSGISQMAFIQKGCTIGQNVSIYPWVYIGEDVVIEDHVTLYPGVFIGDRVKIGEKTVIYPNTSILQDCIIGREVIIHAGTVIGSDGFGFVRDGSMNVKIPQVGMVQIDEQVEIGANNTIDRAAFGKTWIKRGVKTDNLVQIAHNVVIGEDSIVVAQTGISGSTRIGREVVIGGQVGINDHIKIGDRVMIGSQSGVPRSIKDDQVVSGTPALPHKLWLKTTGLISRLPRLYERLRKLEQKVSELEKKMD